MNATLLDWFMMLGALCSGLAVAVTCVVGLVVWLSGGDRRAKN